MSMILSPSPVFRYTGNTGAPLAGGQVFTYQAGTTTKVATYKDSSGTLNTNPIVLNSRGECDLWIAPNVAYKYVIAPSTDTDPPANPIKTIDNVVSSQLITLYGGVDTGSANAYILTFTANFSAYADGIVIYWLPAHNNTAGSTINVNGLGVVNILNQDGTALTANQILANQFSAIIYLSGAFRLYSQGLISGSFTASMTGFGTPPTPTVKYTRSGNVVCLMMATSGVALSNGTGLTLSGLPSVVQPLSTPSVPVYLEDNSTFINGWAYFSGSTITFGAGLAGSTSGFTAGGNKGLVLNQVITYTVQ